MKKIFSIHKQLPNVFFIAGIVLLAVIFVSFSKDFVKVKKIDEEITALEDELLALQDKNIELGKFIQYLDSGAYAEKKARMELGLKKPGESVIVIPDAPEENSLSGESLDDEEKISNFKKWLNYFFGDISRSS